MSHKDDKKKKSMRKVVCYETNTYSYHPVSSLHPQSAKSSSQLIKFHFVILVFLNTLLYFWFH
jgi:hypothetical protein